ncbi:hypothetical protein LTR42_011490 [Elasticomyces elasticus]|nr:hypothetical protein LTR42_011490 [Elasticomyces elasticus]
MSVQELTTAGSSAGAGTPTTRNDKNVRSKERETGGICLLSLDGGGVRGLSTLYLLREIMQQLNDEREALTLNRVKPCEIFDLIGGTSTGGLIAIMLGRLEMDVDECITEYKKLMCTVFDKKKESWLRLLPNSKINPRFSSKVLEKVIKDVINNVSQARDGAIIPNQKPIPIDELFYLESQDRDARRCRVFVCAQRKETGRITLLRSYRPKGKHPGEATIWQAALATTAATSFFEPAKIGDSWTFLVENLKKVATDSDGTAEEVAARWSNKSYFRFNVPHGLEKVGLAECQREKRGLMEAATSDYLDSEETSLRLSRCVGDLRTKEFGLEPNSAQRSEPKAKTSQDRGTQQSRETINKSELIQLTRKAKAYLEQARIADEYRNLNKGHSTFEKILRIQQEQRPPALPKELCDTFNKLRSTSHMLSHLDFPPSDRMEYIDRAARYGERAIHFAIASQNDTRVAQMRFNHACVQAEKMQLRSEEDQRFEAPTEQERRDVTNDLNLSWTALRSIKGSDMTLYEPMKARALGQLMLHS